MTERSEKPGAETSEPANADALVRAHEKLVAQYGERGAAISAMLAVGNLNDVNPGKTN